MLQGFWGKRMPLCGRNCADSNPRIVSSTKLPEFLALLVSDRGAKILDLDHSLSNEDDLSDVRDARHPRVADQLGSSSAVPLALPGTD